MISPTSLCWHINCIFKIINIFQLVHCYPALNLLRERRSENDKIRSFHETLLGKFTLCSYRAFNDFSNWYVFCAETVIDLDKLFKGSKGRVRNGSAFFSTSTGNPQFQCLYGLLIT